MVLTFSFITNFGKFPFFLAEICRLFLLGLYSVCIKVSENSGFGHLIFVIIIPVIFLYFSYHGNFYILMKRPMVIAITVVENNSSNRCGVCVILKKNTNVHVFRVLMQLPVKPLTQE